MKKDYTMLEKWNQEFLVLVPETKNRVMLDLLTNDNVKVVSLIGRAGSGKTLCALAAGLEQTLGNPKERHKEPRYTKMIVSRPVQPMGKDIGFLPGTLEEKMEPWLAPIRDNLQYLLGNDKMMVQEYLDKGVIEIEALSYIRGRSIANAYIIIDEAQNLTRHELKTIITRVGEGTKIILTGDIEQIDNVYINETSNGLVHAVEKFKSYELHFGHVTLLKGERSEVATLGAKYYKIHNTDFYIVEDFTGEIEIEEVIEELEETVASHFLEGIESIIVSPYPEEGRLLDGSTIYITNDFYCEELFVEEAILAIGDFIYNNLQKEKRDDISKYFLFKRAKLFDEYSKKYNNRAYSLRVLG